jgi:hypothetical protein
MASRTFKSSARSSPPEPQSLKYPGFSANCYMKSEDTFDLKLYPFWAELRADPRGT